MIELTQDFENAFQMACGLHGKDNRKGTNIPYMSHLMIVAGMVMENGDYEYEVNAALLHDAVEDKGGKEILSEIREKFGKNTAKIVADCSDTFEDPKPPWEERKKKYIKELPNKQASSRLVSLADKIHNARAILKDYLEIGDKLWERFNASKEDTIWYYRTLLKCFQEIDEPNHRMLVNELKGIINNLEGVMNKR